MAREIQSIPITFANTGIVIKSTADEIPLTSYKMLSNAQTDKENSVSVRKGFVRLNAGLPTAPYSSYYLKDYVNRQWRYAITGGQLYVAPIEDPADASVWPIASTNEFESVIGGSELSAEVDPRALWATFALSGTEMKPYVFMADGTAFLKHSGGMDSARRVGIPRPVNPITGMALEATVDRLIDNCDDYTSWIGGDSSITSAADYPSGWWYGTGTMGARWYYAKYSFVLDDGSETYCSSALYPFYIPKQKVAQMYWKKALSGYDGTALVNPGAHGTYFSDYYAPWIPPNCRVYSIRIQAGWNDVVDRIQVRWQDTLGIIYDAPFHGGGYGTQYEFVLDFDEYITGLKGRRGDAIDSLIIITNKRESQKYGGNGGASAWSVDVPAGTATASNMLVGFHGKTNGDTDYQNVLTDFGIIYRIDSYDDTSTAPANAVGWNLYVGDSANNVHKVNVAPIALGSIRTEPAAGWAYASTIPPSPNVGDVVNDPAGETLNAIKINITGAGKTGRATKVFLNDVGYPIIQDFGVIDPDESFKFSFKFQDAEAKSNCSSIRLGFVLSDIPGDIGESYEYYAVAEITDFSTHTPGAWSQVQLFKNEFTLNNYGGSTVPGIGWSTVSAMYFEVVTKDPASGSQTCNTSFDNVYYSPVGKVNGSDLQWTYTFYNSKTDTESDYADPFANNLGTLTDAQVLLDFPATPYTNPPMANPDTIRIYRMGNTVTQFQLVGEIDYVAGFPFEYLDNVDDNSLGDVLEEDNQLPPEQVEGIEIFQNRLWTWGGVSLDGIVEPLNRLRFSKGTRIEHFPSDNYIYVGSGNEQIMRVLEHDGELFVFTLTKVYRIVGQDGDYRADSTAVNQGLTNKFCACRGTRGLYMRAYDGIYEFPNGRKISEPINQIFFGETVNGIEPVAAGREPEEAMGFSDSKVFFSYCATDDGDIRNDRMLIWDTQYERWFWYIYGAQNLYAEPETNILIGDNLTQWYSVVPGEPVEVRRSGAYPMKLEYGNADECSDPDTGDLIEYGIPCIIDTREYDLGSPDQEKQFIDLTVDADTQGYPVTLQASFDGGEFEIIGVIQTSERQRIVFPMVLGDENSRLAVRMSVRISFESDPDADSSTRIYKIVHRVLIEPPKHRTFVTDWDYSGHAGPKYYHRLWVEMDTFGVALEGIEVQVDQVVIKTISDNVTADGRLKFYYGLGIDVRGTLSRLKFITQGDNEIKVYDYGLEVTPEPPLINSIQTQWTDNGFPYRKLWKHVQLDIDTGGKLIEFNFWVDNEIKQTFQVITTARQHIVQSLDQEMFGKIGRITVDVAALDSDGELQGVRMYSEPIFVTEERNPDVTIADSFEKTFNYERLKVLKQLYYVIENPNAEVTLNLYIDNVLKDTYTIATVGDVYPAYTIRRQDFKTGRKGKIFRFVFTSSQAFEIDWPHSHLVLRDVNTEDPQRRPRLEPPQTY